VASAVELAEQTWPEVEATLLVVPLGSTEQHGPHLPLGTDTTIAVALARGLAAERPGVVVAPALAFGSSGEHEGFAGTLSIGQTATELVVVELCRSASASFERVVLVSTHGGNAEVVARAARTLHDEGRAVLVWSPRWRGDAHAGRIETSLMLALAPESVRVARTAAGNTEPIEALMPRLLEEGVRAASPNGVLGDPQGASAEEGRELMQQAIRDLLDAVSGL
jgi:mycofactocin precursor peptide peptidase